jgi:hypothetical protein
MRDDEVELLKKAARLENRNMVLRLRLQGGEELHAKIISLPCDCGMCTDRNVIYEQVWSSSKDMQAQWERDRREKNVGGYGVPIDMIESVEVLSTVPETQ